MFIIYVLCHFISMISMKNLAGKSYSPFEIFFLTIMMISSSSGAEDEVPTTSRSNQATFSHIVKIESRITFSARF